MKIPETWPNLKKKTEISVNTQSQQRQGFIFAKKQYQKISWQCTFKGIHALGYVSNYWHEHTYKSILPP
jgi:hypothetical protein